MYWNGQRLKIKIYWIQLLYEKTTKIVAKYYLLFSSIYLFKNTLHKEIINYYGGVGGGGAIYLSQQFLFQCCFSLWEHCHQTCEPEYAQCIKQKSFRKKIPLMQYWSLSCNGDCSWITYSPTVQMLFSTLKRFSFY